MKLKWNLKLVTAVLAMIYGLCTVVFAGYGYYLQRTWFEKDARDKGAPEAEIAQLISDGKDQADVDAALKRMAERMGWIDSFVAPAADDNAPILAGSNSQLDGQDREELAHWYGTYWVGSIDETFPGADGKQYTILAVRPDSELPWPFFQVMALIAAVAAWLAVTTWLYFDAADREGSRAFGWLVLGLLGGPVGLGVWLISRPTLPEVTPTPADCAAPALAEQNVEPEALPLAPAVEPVAPAAPVAADSTICADCGGQSPQDAAFCVRCGHPLQPVCPQCRRPVALDWSYCAACGADLTE